jgi:YebC/PmpR family DNA-binding regulatory protein
MSGHSKWANIKNRKGAQDKKRSETFTRMAKTILTAVRENGGNTNPDSNFHLKAAIEKAKEVNMPKENIQRLLENFESKKANLGNYMFEGYGPLGVPLLVEVETDNKNRAIAEIKALFRRYEGSLGESGSVMYQFEKRGEVEVVSLPEEKQLEVIDAGAEEIEGATIWISPENLRDFVESLGKAGIEVKSFQVVYKMKAPVKLANEDEVAKVLDLVEALEENDEVINVYSGFDYTA